MGYVVKTMFFDLQDGNHRYQVGEGYPREGYKPSKARIEELASDKNKQGVPLIAEVKEEEAPKKTSKKGK